MGNKVNKQKKKEKKNENAVSGTVVYDIAKETFNKANLNMPYVPTDMLPSLQKFGDWIYGTKSTLLSPPNLSRWTTVRHGEGSIQLHLQLQLQLRSFWTRWTWFQLMGYPLLVCAVPVDFCLTRRKHVGIFFQVHWGGIEGGRETDEEVNRSLEYAKKILDKSGAILGSNLAVEELQKEGRVKNNQRLFVVRSDFHGSRWAIVEDPDINWMSVPFDISSMDDMFPKGTIEEDKRSLGELQVLLGSL